MSVNTRTLDHIVHLTPPGSLEETTEQFKKLGFNVIPGGTHAGGLTANALVVLADGIYLELIFFTHPESDYPPGSPEREKRDANPWSHKPYGWIDYAFLGNGSHQESIAGIINERAKKDGSGAAYLQEQDGGRTRPDGEVLKWLISAPEQNQRRGTLPFFCGDVTPRTLRVPSDPPANTVHPSTAQGIAHVRILTDNLSLIGISKQLTSVIGNEPNSSNDNEVVWSLDSVHLATNAPRLYLSAPSTDAENQYVSDVGTGIYEVGFRIQKGKAGSVMTPYGKIAWILEE
ncbi:glyoxalase-like domain-containing protein [Crucibulum laeve]|uniref:Glyoxalase-like domain-containing protein n=1 Tax=Crucibulum laeve TaxID=68775 RepID=A0A5C3M1P9_9AGAR|nr:glyoxalase-like domain-containing protein [Crucibulum laeve]